MSVTSKPALEALLGGQAALRTAGPDFAPVLRWRKSGVNPGQVVSGQQSAGLREPSKEGGTASSFTGHVIFWVNGLSCQMPRMEQPLPRDTPPSCGVGAGPPS